MCVQLVKEQVTVEILHQVRSIRFSFGYLRKQPTIKSAFLAEIHLRFNFYENGPSFIFQYVFKCKPVRL